VKESTIGLMRNKPLLEQVGTRIQDNTAKDIGIYKNTNQEETCRFWFSILRACGEKGRGKGVFIILRKNRKFMVVKKSPCITPVGVTWDKRTAA
jgi:hypothetical protein